MENEYTQEELEGIMARILSLSNKKLLQFIHLIEHDVRWPLLDDEIIKFFRNDPYMASSQLAEMSKNKLLQILKKLE